MESTVQAKQEGAILEEVANHGCAENQLSRVPTAWMNKRRIAPISKHWWNLNPNYLNEKQEFPRTEWMSQAMKPRRQLHGPSSNQQRAEDKQKHQNIKNLLK